MIVTYYRQNSTGHRGLYCNHLRNINYDSSIINKFGASITDDTRVVIYEHHMLIVQGNIAAFTTLNFLCKLRIGKIS
jgi:hypothetical protein